MEKGITKSASECTHPEDKIDYRWSHGMAGRCGDCGAVNNGGIWDDTVAEYAAIEAFLILEKNNPEPKIRAAVDSYTRAAKFNRLYMREADKRDKIGYQEVVSATVAELIAEAPEKP